MTATERLFARRAELWQQLAQNVANAHALMAALEVLDRLIAETPSDPPPPEPPA